MVNKKDLREFTRVRLEVEASGEEESGRSLKGTISDISAKGLYLICKNPPDEGLTCKITIQLVNEKKSIPIDLVGRVTRREVNGAAFEYRSVSVESFEKLKRLILFNAENPLKVEREYTSYFGIKHK